DGNDRDVRANLDDGRRGDRLRRCDARHGHGVLLPRARIERRRGLGLFKRGVRDPMTTVDAEETADWRGQKRLNRQTHRGSHLPCVTPYLSARLTSVASGPEGLAATGKTADWESVGAKDALGFEGPALRHEVRRFRLDPPRTKTEAWALGHREVRGW